MDDTRTELRDGLVPFSTAFERIYVSPDHLKSWVSGYIDGEGCFAVDIERHNTKGGYTRLCPSFSMVVRADDRMALYIVKRVIGLTTEVHVRDRGGRHVNPIAQMKCSKIDDLIRIVEHLDRYPLLAKKSAEYSVWREAVVMHVKPTVSRKSKRATLEMLREVLQKSKPFAALRGTELSIDYRSMNN